MAGVEFHDLAAPNPPATPRFVFGRNPSQIDLRTQPSPLKRSSRRTVTWPHAIELKLFVKTTSIDAQTIAPTNRTAWTVARVQTAGPAAAEEGGRNVA